MHRQKKQSTPQQRARKNKEDGSLHFFHRPPESGLILHRSCVIYDGGGPPVSQRKLGGPNRKLRSINNKKIPQPWEVGPSQHPVMAPHPFGKVPPTSATFYRLKHLLISNLDKYTLGIMAGYHRIL